MQKRRWYLIAYDIADKKRLIQVYRKMKQSGLAAQRSVFLTQGTQSDINALLDRIQPVIKTTEDDLRAYPVTNMEDIWSSGLNFLNDYPLFYLS